MQVLEKYPHRRYNPLTGEWIIVSPLRAVRPIRGHSPNPTKDKKPDYDPECYLYPGNMRANVRPGQNGG